MAVSFRKYTHSYIKTAVLDKNDCNSQNGHYRPCQPKLALHVPQCNNGWFWKQHHWLTLLQNKPMMNQIIVDMFQWHTNPHLPLVLVATIFHHIMPTEASMIHHWSQSDDTKLNKLIKQGIVNPEDKRINAIKAMHMQWAHKLYKNFTKLIW
jgi:hypothetical protein